MAMILADTDVLIDYLNQAEPIGPIVKRYIDAEKLVTSAITVFELLSGAGQNKRGEKTRSLIEKVPCLPLDAESARHAASLRQLLEAKGQPLAMADLMIAGTAMAHGIPLLTRNQKHFARIADLRLVPLSKQSN